LPWTDPKSPRPEAIAAANNWAFVSQSESNGTVTYIYNEGIISYNIDSSTEEFGDFSVIGSTGAADGLRDEVIWDQSKAKLDLNGIVRIQGDLTVGSKNLQINSGGVTYSGKGSFYTDDNPGTGGDGDIEIHSSLLTPLTGDATVDHNSFPINNSIGFIAKDDMKFVQVDVNYPLTLMGSFYATEDIIAEKDHKVAGSLVSTQKVETKEGASIYQVPTLSSNLPPGMPDVKGFVVQPSYWREL